MKRAFCEPGNADVNPPLAIARDVAIEFFGSLSVGDKVRYLGFQHDPHHAHFPTDPPIHRLTNPPIRRPTHDRSTLLLVLSAHSRWPTTRSMRAMPAC